MSGKIFTHSCCTCLLMYYYRLHFINVELLTSYSKTQKLYPCCFLDREWTRNISFDLSSALLSSKLPTWYDYDDGKKSSNW